MEKIYDKKTGLAKAEHFCAYQERSQQEVRDKLYGYGLHAKEVEEVISELIQSNFLNEERFALAYCSGKFRLKQWGKGKIKQGLIAKRVAPPLIKKALATLDPDEYAKALSDLLEKKNCQISENDPYKRKHKLIQYALTKGFEQELIFDVLNSNDLV